MPKIVIVDKYGSLKTVNLKDFSVNTICNKAGIKSIDGFKLQNTWGADDGLDQNIRLYAKTEGRAGQENKYDFPPPVDERLFFGACALVGFNAETNEPVDLDEDAWEDIYEFLFGGFDDVDSCDESEVDTDEELNAVGVPVAITKQGYVKDGFIVESDEESEEESDEESESEEEEKPKTAVIKKVLLKKVAPVKKKVDVVVEQPLVMEDCGDELSEEDYE